MVAKSIAEVRTALSAGAEAQAFAKGFADIYFGQALGSLPKTEIDLLVFGLLIEQGVIDPDGPVFAIARALNVTPAKARNMLFQYQLRAIDDAQMDALVLGTIAKAKITVDDKRLSLGIESPLVRAAIDGRLKQRGVFADISLSGDILRVPLDRFGEFVGTILTVDQAQALQRDLKREGHLKRSALKAGLTGFALEVGKGGAGAIGAQGFSSFFTGLQAYVAGGGLTGLLKLASHFA